MLRLPFLSIEESWRVHAIQFSAQISKIAECLLETVLEAMVLAGRQVVEEGRQ